MGGMRGCGGAAIGSARRRLAVLGAVAAGLLALPAAAGASSAGQLYAFGLNSFGQLGSATNSGTENPNPTPTRVSLPGATGPVVQIAAGGSHSLALTATGELYAFGLNGSGQLGSATNNGTANPNPTPIAVTLPGATGPVVQIAAGNSHSLALTATGQLYAFGLNDVGQLGRATNSGTTNPNPTPTPVSLPGATGPVVQIAAGGSHSLALTATGQLYAFGYNFYGQLGSATNSGTVKPNPTPTPVSLPGATGPVVQIAAGDLHSLALTATGQLYAFGLNDFGQLGSATNNGTTNPNPTPTPVTPPGATGLVVQIAAGNSHSLALTATGQLYAFGLNGSGQLGSATNSGTENPNPTPTPVSLPGAVSVDTVASGAVHSLVVTADLSVATDSLAGGTAGVPYHARVDASGGTAPYQWSASGLPAGLAIDAASGEISGIPERAANSDVTVTVADRYGIVAAKTLALAVAAAPPSPPSPSSAPPRLSRLAVSPRQLSLAGRLVGGSCKPLSASNRRKSPCRQKLRLRVSFELDSAATVTVRFARLSVGRQLRGGCAKATRANRKRPRCTRAIPVGSPITQQAAAGADTLAITRPALPSGRYRLTATPSTPGREGAPQAAGFTITG